jgi:hypothetical protein
MLNKFYYIAKFFCIDSMMLLVYAVLVSLVEATSSAHSMICTALPCPESSVMCLSGDPS